jgi:DNA-binding LacI/PurR family transcriptional regulator
MALLDAAQLLGNRNKHNGASRAVIEIGLPSYDLIVVKLASHSATDRFQAIGEAMQSMPQPAALFATTARSPSGLCACTESRACRPRYLAIVGHHNTEAANFSSAPITSSSFAAAEIRSW